MISASRFDAIRNTYGHFASWALWRNESTTPKEHIGDLTVFDVKQNPNLLDTLHARAILIGLNISRPIALPLGNFHDPRPMATDFKIRYALRETQLWGAYMTDIIKDFEEKASGRMVSYVRKHPEFLKENIKQLLNEINLLGNTNPILIAFGRDAKSLLEKHLDSQFHILGIPHYASYMSKEKYRSVVHATLKEYV